MKIKETDFLWSCYLRYYEGEGEKTPPPSNLCRYFWTAMMGLGAKVYCDSNMFLSMACFGIIFCLIVGFSVIVGPFLDEMNESVSVVVVMPIVLSMIFTFFSMMVIPIIKISEWMSEKVSEEQFRKVMLVIMCCFGVGMLYALIFHHRPWDEAWAELLKSWPYGVGMFLGLPALFGIGYCIYHPLITTEVFRTFWAYLMAKKQKVCPLVEPPESWKCHENGTNSSQI
jgi:hypothetical protein